MTTASPQEIAHKLGSGLLSFPVTHFTEDHSFDEAAYRENIGWLGQFDASGLFAAGGTGEFFSLTPPEVEQVVRAAVQEAPDGLPVIAPAGYGTATAVQMARSAESAGAHGILLLPPYLTEASQDGLVAHVKGVCAATTLGVTIYSRANAVYTESAVAELADSCPNLVGFKDGVGNIEQMTRIYASLGDRLTYVADCPPPRCSPCRISPWASPRIPRRSTTSSRSSHSTSTTPSAAEITRSSSTPSTSS